MAMAMAMVMVMVMAMNHSYMSHHIVSLLPSLKAPMPRDPIPD